MIGQKVWMVGINGMRHEGIVYKVAGGWAWVSRSGQPPFDFKAKLSELRLCEAQ